MRNPITNNLPAKLDQFLMDMAQSEDDLTDMQKDLIKEIALADFECGHFTDVSFFIDDEEDDFTGVEQAAADYYTELINMGPAGFYEEFRDELDFDPDFVAEYGDPEDDDDLVENALDENYDDIYSATFKAKGFVNQMRKTYDDATIIQAVKTCLKESKKYKR